jgi:hypothetical protein
MYFVWFNTREIYHHRAWTGRNVQQGTPNEWNELAGLDIAGIFLRIDLSTAVLSAHKCFSFTVRREGIWDMSFSTVRRATSLARGVER